MTSQEASAGRPRIERPPMTGPAAWDDRYSVPDYSFGRAPNQFVAACAGLFTPGLDVLVPADGEGRNGVFCAERGCRVTSVDYSEVGLDKTRKLAAERGVEVETICADLTRWDWPVAAFDRVVLVYFHLPPALRALVHERCAAALRPGGMIVLEGFQTAQVELQKTEDSGGPPDVAMLFSPEMLRADFPELEVLTLDEVETVLDEGPFHTGRAAVIRFVARKSAASNAGVRS